MDIKEICLQPESSHIEYKSEWYWKLDEQEIEQQDKTKLWGEFIKDVLALINSNVRSFDTIRYMIIGYDENMKEFIDFNLDENIFQKLKSKIISKLDMFISDFSDIDCRISLESIDHINVIVFEVKQPFKIHCLTKNIQTKSIPYKQNTILYRGKDDSTGDKHDNVGVMHNLEIRQLESKMKNKFGAKFISINLSRTKTIRNTILSYLEKNRSFKLADNSPINNENSKDYFELYEITNTLNKDKTYFAYVSDSNIKKSIENLHYEFFKYYKEPEKIILLVDKPKGTSPEQRLSYIKKTYKTNFGNDVNIEFIEDFGKKHLYQEYLEPLLFDHNFQNTENFVESFSSETNESQDNSFATEILEKWFLEENNPLVVLTGPGGVGKTTVVRSFLNKQLKKIQKSENHYVLFLDSSSLLDQLKSDRVSTIYDLYRAEISDSEHFTEELFKLSIDNGSFTIILDGLDEIISGVSIKFQLQSFLKNIFEDYCSNLAKTKIIITCRDYIWDEAFNLISEDLVIQNMYIRPFNKDQTEEYFSSCFKNNIRLRKTSMKIVENLINKSDDKYYSPFMLDTVRNLVESEINENNIENIFEIDDSDAYDLCLRKNSILDYLIYAVCKREVKKTNIDFAHQIGVLCRLSEINKNTDQTNFAYIVRDFIKDANETTIASLLTHPFICYTAERKITIRYDFLKDFFLKISVSQYFIREEELSLELHSLLSSKVSYLNNFSLEVGSRLSKLDPDCLQLFILDNIEKLDNKISITEDVTKEQVYKFYISNLFILYLGILKSNNLLQNSETLNEVLTNIFSNKENILSNLYLCNIRSTKATPKFLFNFSDFQIINCYIYRFQNFTDCIFNEHTRFVTGTIDIDFPQASKYSLKPYNISANVLKTGKTAEVLESIDNSLEKEDERKRNTLRKFLKIFFKNGRFMPKKTAEVRNKWRGQDINSMIENNIITINRESKLNQDEYIVNPLMEKELFNFWDSGVTSLNIKNIINSI